MVGDGGGVALLLEGHVTEAEHRAEQGPHPAHLRRPEAHRAHGGLGRREHRALVLLLPLGGDRLRPAQVLVGRDRAQLQLCAQGGGRGGGQVVEHVVASLARLLLHDAHLLEEVRLYCAPHDPARQVELQHEELAVARRVVVEHGLRVAEGLEQRRGGEHALLRGW